MPTVKNVVKDVPKMLNAFAAEQEGTPYAGLLPEVTTEDTLKSFSNVLFQYQPLFSSMMGYLLYKVAFTKIGKMYYTNPLQHAKRGKVPYGYTIEDIWVDIATPHVYDPKAETTEDAASMLRTELPPILSVFHNLNRAEYYKKTVYETEIRRAFNSFDGVGRLVDTIINSLYTGNDVSEYAYTTSIFGNFADIGAFKQVKVTPITNKDTAEDFLVAVRQISGAFRFPSREYNPMGVMNTSEIGNQILYLTPKVDAQLSVKALAYAFHMDEASFAGRTVLIDEVPNHPEIVAIMADEAFLNVYDALFESREFFNGEKLYTNYWLHVHQYYFASPWHNAVAFVTNDVPTVASVAVTATPAAYTPGSSVTLKATVTGTNNPAQTVRYVLSGNTSQSTMIQGNTLVPGIDETGTLTVEAISIVDNTKSASVNIAKASA